MIKLLKNKTFWIIVSAILGPFLASIVLLYPDIFKSPDPLFDLENIFSRPDTSIYLISRNAPANNYKTLDIEFDGFLLRKAGIPIKNTNPQKWSFSLINKNLPDTVFKDGIHKIRAIFTENKFNNEYLQITLNSKAPVVGVNILKQNFSDKFEYNKISIKAASRTQSLADTIKVEISYYHDGQQQVLNIPVRKIITEQSGVFYYEFETSLQNLPHFTSKDTEFSKTFFSIKVTDQAGNKYYETQSYAEFMAPGDKYFGINDMADIQVAKQTDRMNNSVSTLVRFIPNVKLIYNINGTPAIVLKVTNIAKNYRELEWKSNVNNPAPLTLVYKNDKTIGTSFTNNYLDVDTIMSKIIKYRVEQISGINKETYSSNAIEYNPDSRKIIDSLIKLTYSLQILKHLLMVHPDSLYLFPQEYHDLFDYAVKPSSNHYSKNGEIIITPKKGINTDNYRIYCYEYSDDTVKFKELYGDMPTFENNKFIGLDCKKYMITIYDSDPKLIAYKVIDVPSKK